MASLRAIALIAARNEEDIISQVLEHLIREGLEVYLLDDGSTDETVAEASRWIGRGLLKIEQRPAGRVFNWTALLRWKEELASELDADWFLHHDADEFRECPWPDKSLLEGIRQVDVLGYNAIDFCVLNFPPTHDRFALGMDVRETFRYFEPAPSWDRFQIKAWKRGLARVDLVSSGGHDVVFPDRRVCPIQFLCRHYPIRGQAQGQKKVIAERLGRLSPDEVDRGWHIQYNKFGRSSTFIRDGRELREFDPETVRSELLTSGREGYLRRVEAEVADKLRHDLTAGKEAAERALQELNAELSGVLARLRTAEAARKQAHDDWLESQACLRASAAELQELRAASAAQAQEAARMLAAVQAEAARRIDSLEADLRHLTADLAGVYASMSWRVTRPLRRGYEMLNPSATRNPADAPDDN